MNVEVSNHMQALEEEQIKALDKKFKASQVKDTNKQNTQNNHQKSNNNKQNLTIKKNSKIRIIVNQRRKRTKQQRKTAK